MTPPNDMPAPEDLELAVTAPVAQPASSSANGTSVVLPAPGGAVRTAAPVSSNAARNAGSASSTGNPIGVIMRHGLGP